MYSEDEFIQLSALQHYLFCERQCYLIHVEQIWEDNIFTAEGNVLHRNADDQKAAERGESLRIEYGLPIRSMRLGLSGKADVVEFHKKEDGKWLPFPVEYKRGKPKKNGCDKVQLCAQAICLEEMLSTSVPEGALFYGKTRHRKGVEFDRELRNLTEDVCTRTHELLRQEKPPPAVFEKDKCPNCSLINLCLPRVSGKSVYGYLSSMSSLSSESSSSSRNEAIP